MPEDEAGAFLPQAQAALAAFAARPGVPAGPGRQGGGRPHGLGAHDGVGGRRRVPPRACRRTTSRSTPRRCWPAGATSRAPSRCWRPTRATAPSRRAADAARTAVGSSSGPAVTDLPATGPRQGPEHAGERVGVLPRQPQRADRGPAQHPVGVDDEHRPLGQPERPRQRPSCAAPPGRCPRAAGTDSPRFSAKRRWLATSCEADPPHLRAEPAQQLQVVLVRAQLPGAHAGVSSPG